jgi:hypothetical protein
VVDQELSYAPIERCYEDATPAGRGAANQGPNARRDPKETASDARVIQALFTKLRYSV